MFVFVLADKVSDLERVGLCVLFKVSQFVWVVEFYFLLLR